MRNKTDALRTTLAGVVGLLVATASALALVYAGIAPAGTRFTAMHWGTTGWVALAAMAALLTVTLARTYANWFDGLFAGPSAWRGAQFGIIAWIWLAAICALVTQSGWMRWHATDWARMAMLTGLPALAYGVVVGTIVGGRRRDDFYTSGLSYGLPDRRSLG